MSATRRRIRYDVLIGPVLGAGLGLIIAKGLPGAVLGAIAGHLLQRRLKGGPSRATPVAERSGTFFGDAARSAERIQGMVRLMVAIGRYDGPMTDHEAKAVRSYFERDARMPAMALRMVDALVQRERQAPQISPQEAARSMPRLDPQDRAHLVFVLFRVALADRALGRDEDRALREVALAIGLTDDDFDRVRACFIDDDADPTGYDYELLGLAPGADQQSVRESYKKAVRTYHPDRFQHLGKEFSDTAAEKFKSVQAAYRRILDHPKTSGRQRPRASLCQNCRTFTAADEATCIRCGFEKHRAAGGDVHMRCPYCTQVNAYPAAGSTGLIRCGNCKVVLVR